MIQTHIVHPVETAGTQVYLVEIVEHLCRKYCPNASVQPTGEVSFEAGPTRIINGYPTATITAKVSTLTPKCQMCGCATPQIFTERFDVVFPDTDTGTISVDKGPSTIVEPAYKGCCAARGIKLSTTVTVTIG